MANAARSVDLPNCIARIFETLMRLLLPVPGRHRRDDRGNADQRPDMPAVPLPRGRVPVLDGEEISLALPYVIAHERREPGRPRPVRPRELCFASRGVDMGHLLIHGVEVTR